jgi:rhamnulokinase
MNDSGPVTEAGSGSAVRARVAIDLGAESCRVSLLRWRDDCPTIELIHRIPNGPVHANGSLTWPFDKILLGLEEGLRKAAEAAPEGIASIAVDGWAVDYVRLGENGQAVRNPFCYRDERTIATKQKADELAGPLWMFQHTGAQPLRINTVYQLLADQTAGFDTAAPWVGLPEYVLLRLGGRRVAEYTTATHTRESLPPIVPAGTVLGKLQGPLSELAAYRDTDLVAPACHDTASAIAGIRSSLADTAYICSGTWSLVGTLIANPITTQEAMDASYTNQGAACDGFCFHTNVNGMWTLKQCLESWRKAGRLWELQTLIAQAAACDDFPGIVPVDAAPLLLDGDMPALLNEQLCLQGIEPVEDCAGNEPMFARIIFESLASRYASALRNLEHMLGSRLKRIHILGGGSLNQLLTRLTAERTGLPVETGNVESSTIGNFAVQLASAEAGGGAVKAEAVRRWAHLMCEDRATNEEPALPPQPQPASK